MTCSWGGRPRGRAHAHAPCHASQDEDEQDFKLPWEDKEDELAVLTYHEGEWRFAKRPRSWEEDHDIPSCLSKVHAREEAGIRVTRACTRRRACDQRSAPGHNRSYLDRDSIVFGAAPRFRVAPPELVKHSRWWVRGWELVDPVEVPYRDDPYPHRIRNVTPAARSIT